MSHQRIVDEANGKEYFVKTGHVPFISNREILEIYCQYKKLIQPVLVEDGMGNRVYDRLYNGEEKDV